MANVLDLRWRIRSVKNTRQIASAVATASMVLLFSGSALAGPANPADYPVKVHVSSSRLVVETKGSTSLIRTATKLHLDVTIDGRKLELLGDTSDLLRIGDYPAKVKSTDAARSYIDSTTYELLFPDGKTHEFQVVGETE